MSDEMKEVCTLPNGCTLYSRPNGVGGTVYYSDEVGGGVLVWDTSLVDDFTLLAAILEEKKNDFKRKAKSNTTR